MMTIPHPSRSIGAVLLAAALPLAALHAGDEPPPATQMNDYLQGQKITHSVEVTGGDFKGGGAEMLTVKIYGVADGAQQDSICTTLAATAKKSRVKGATTVLFYTQAAPAGGQGTFQPSRLPGGNGEPDFGRDMQQAGYHLQRTVKL